MTGSDQLQMRRMQGKYWTVCIQLVGREDALQLLQDQAANSWAAEVKPVSMKLTFLNQSVKDS